MKMLFLMLMIFASPGMILAQDTTPAASPDQVKNAFVQMNNELNSFQSDFTQSKELSFMNKPLISSGKFYYQKSDKLRWEYVEPLQYTMLINGESVRIEEGGEVKSYSSAVNEIFRTIKEIVLGCISGDILNHPEYEASYFENEELYEVRIKPEKEELRSFIKEVSIFISRKKNLLHHLEMRDGNGDKTTIQFENSVINEPINAGVFNEF